MASAPLVKGEVPGEKRSGEQGIITQGFITITEGKNMTQSRRYVRYGGNVRFWMCRRLYFNVKILCLEN